VKVASILFLAVEARAVEGVEECWEVDEEVSPVVE
jgi:hypothetical protein